jgi:hypothetical protein
VAGDWEKHVFLGREMDFDFRFEVLLDLRLPSLQIGGRDGLGAIDAHT